ncbi:hypothetical protein PS15m_001010 [Mucor circinelloides]
MNISFLGTVSQHIMEVKQAFEYFALLEQQFWKNLDQKTIQHVTFAGDLKPEDMLLYGEFGFALLGLKPAVLVEFCDEAINKLYLETVIKPVLHAIKEKTLDYHIIQHAVTPESALNGCIFIYQTKQSALPELAFIMSNTATAVNDTEVSEESMATILDYPGHLPNTEKEISTMLSVIYFHDRPNQKGLIALTSFAIQNVEKEKTLAHFKRYQEVCKEKLNVDLKLLIQ